MSNQMITITAFFTGCPLDIVGGHQSLDADLDWRLRQLETDLMKIPKQSPATTTTNNLFAPAENDLAMELRHLSESDILDPNSTNPGLAPNAILLCLLFVKWKRLLS